MSLNERAFFVVQMQICLEYSAKKDSYYFICNLVCVAMVSKKRNLTSAQIQELLEQSLDSNVSDSEFDDTEEETNSDAVYKDTDSSNATVDYSCQQSACDVFNQLSGASTRQCAAFTGQSGICAFMECSGPASELDRKK